MDQKFSHVVPVVKHYTYFSPKSFATAPGNFAEHRDDITKEKNASAHKSRRICSGRMRKQREAFQMVQNTIEVGQTEIFNAQYLVAWMIRSVRDGPF